MSPSAWPTSTFAFMTCQVGAEPALKAEVQRATREPASLRPAFMRPGFVTFKSERPLSSTFAPDLVFARRVAVSLGKCDQADVVARALDLARAHDVAALHVWMRDAYAPGDAPMEYDDDAHHAPARALAERLLAVVPLRTESREGDVVLDVVGVDAGLWYLGLHVHASSSSSDAGGDPRLTVPAEAPSRAWAKLEQMVRAFDVPLRAGDRVVEIGASPGGVTHALLTRGCDVVAIDPGEMDARVLASPHVRHLRAPVADVDPSSIEGPVRFIVLDVNISPFAALRQIEAMVKAHARDLHGLLLTLKLGDWHMAARVPHLLSIVKKLDPSIVDVRAKQLPANKVEICVAAVTAAGVKERARLKGSGTAFR